MITGSGGYGRPATSVAAPAELALPTELAVVGEWVEGGGLLVFGRRRVLFVRFVLCVAAALYFFV